MKYKENKVAVRGLIVKDRNIRIYPLYVYQYINITTGM